MLSFLPLVSISLLCVVCFVQADRRLAINQCRFDVDGRMFDLCPVFDLLQAGFIVDVPSTGGVLKSYRWTTADISHNFQVCDIILFLC